MDAVTKAVIETIEGNGFDVRIRRADGRHVAEAESQATGETFVVRGDDLYRVACELAQQCGIELEDG